MKLELEQVYAASAARLAPYRERARQRNELASAEQAVLLEDDVDAWKARYGADVTRWPGYRQAANLGRQVEDMDKPVIAEEVKRVLPYLVLAPASSAEGLVEEFRQQHSAGRTVQELCWHVLQTRSNHTDLFRALHDTFARNGLYQFSPWPDLTSACGAMHDLMRRVCAVVVRAYGLEGATRTLNGESVAGYDPDPDILAIAPGSLLRQQGPAVRVLAHAATANEDNEDVTPYATDEIDAWIAEHA